MVRPIEITDSLSKVQAVEHMQQDAKTRPEALHQFQKTLTAKQVEQIETAPNPVPESDQVVLHIDQQEKEKRKTAEDEQPEKNNHESGKNGSGSHDSEKERQDEDHCMPGHIDIKV